MFDLNHGLEVNLRVRITGCEGAHPGKAKLARAIAPISGHFLALDDREGRIDVAHVVTVGGAVKVEINRVELRPKPQAAVFIPRPPYRHSPCRGRREPCRAPCRSVPARPRARFWRPSFCRSERPRSDPAARPVFVPEYSSRNVWSALSVAKHSQRRARSGSPLSKRHHSECEEFQHPCLGLAACALLHTTV